MLEAVVTATSKVKKGYVWLPFTSFFFQVSSSTLDWAAVPVTSDDHAKCLTGDLSQRVFFSTQPRHHGWTWRRPRKRQPCLVIWTSLLRCPLAAWFRSTLPFFLKRRRRERERKRWERMLATLWFSFVGSEETRWWFGVALIGRVGDLFNSLHVRTCVPSHLFYFEPRRPQRPQGFHTTAREPKRAHLRVPAFKNTTKIPREDPQREREKRAKMETGEGKKARHFERSGGGGSGGGRGLAEEMKKKIKKSEHLKNK